MTERAASEEARRAIEAKVLEVQKLESLGVLAGGIAHDFNNLLVAIMGNAGLALLDLPRGLAGAGEHHRRRDRQPAARGELARQMLAYSGSSRFRIEPVELSDLVARDADAAPGVDRQGRRPRARPRRRPVVVEADAAQLRQVVMNLVINAADAIGDRSGTVTIRVDRRRWPTPPYLARRPSRTQASDRAATRPSRSRTPGSGMDATTQARIFDPFFTTKFTGRGLGLAAVLGIVRGHGGALRVYSELGRGIDVPGRPAAERLVAASGRADAADGWHARRRSSSSTTTRWSGASRAACSSRSG